MTPERIAELESRYQDRTTAITASIVREASDVLECISAIKEQAKEIEGLSAENKDHLFAIACMREQMVVDRAELARIKGERDEAVELLRLFCKETTSTSQPNSWTKSAPLTEKKGPPPRQLWIKAGHSGGLAPCSCPSPSF